MKSLMIAISLFNFEPSVGLISCERRSVYQNSYATSLHLRERGEVSRPARRYLGI